MPRIRRRDSDTQFPPCAPAAQTPARRCGYGCRLWLCSHSRALAYRLPGSRWLLLHDRAIRLRVRCLNLMPNTVTLRDLRLVTNSLTGGYLLPVISSLSSFAKVPGGKAIWAIFIRLFCVLFGASLVLSVLMVYS